MKTILKLLRRPLDAVDGFLDGLTSYKLVLYFLIILLGWGVVLSLGNNLPFSWYDVVFSATIIVAICRLSGELFARVLNIGRNFESDYITGLILSLIMSPAATTKGFAILAGAGFAAIASKYLLTFGRRTSLIRRRPAPLSPPCYSASTPAGGSALKAWRR